MHLFVNFEPKIFLNVLKLSHLICSYATGAYLSATIDDANV